MLAEMAKNEDSHLSWIDGEDYYRESPKPIVMTVDWMNSSSMNFEFLQCQYEVILSDIGAHV